jgi:hypothetical protein
LGLPKRKNLIKNLSDLSNIKEYRSETHLKVSAENNRRNYKKRKVLNLESRCPVYKN